MKRYGTLILILLMTGCVTTGKFKAQQERANTLEEQLADTKKELDSVKLNLQNTEQDLRAATEQLASANEQIASLKKSNTDLQKSLEAKKGELTKKVADLIKEKDALSQKLAEKSVETADLRQTKDKEISQLNRTIEDTQAEAKAKEEEISKVTKSYDDLTTSLKSEIAAGQVTITQLKGKLTVNMVDSIVFDSGRSEVRSAGSKVLKQIGNILNDVQDKDIFISGHTDNIPIGGELKKKYATNWELSTARATAIARYLQDHAKVAPERLVAAGYGQYRPVAPNDTPENRRLNRRIEIILVPKK